MGIDQWVKRTLHHRYPAGFEEPLDQSFAPPPPPPRPPPLQQQQQQQQQHRDATANSVPLPPAEVYLFDATNRLKYFPKPLDGQAPIGTGYAYWDEHIQRDIREALDSGGHSVYLCYDRGSPEIKSIEHRRRYRHTVLMEEPPLEDGPLVTHIHLPPPEQWDGFVNHPQLRYDLMAYLTHAFLDDFGEDPAALAVFGSKEEAARHTFTPPPDTCVFLHGGTLQGRETVRHVRDLPPHVFFVESAAVAPAPPPSPSLDEGDAGDGCRRREKEQARGQDSDSQRWRRQQQQRQQTQSRTYRRHAGYLSEHDVPEWHVTNLLEGEQACLYYANRRHPTETCCFVSSDGDLLLMLLLLARDRIDPDTGRFRNRHLLVLRMPGASDDEVVDVNRLYEDMMADPVFKRAGVADPVLALVALACLVKNDYIHGFAPGIAHESMAQLHKKGEAAKKATASMWEGDLAYAVPFREAGWPPAQVGHQGQLFPDPSLKVPYVWALAFEQPQLLRNLVRVVGPRGNSQQPVKVLLNEQQFIALVEALYVKKHGPMVAKKRKVGSVDEVTYDMVRTELLDPKRSARNHPMPRRVVRRFSRQLLWVLRYWINGTRGDCVTESPLAEYQDLPYYGWQATPTGCLSAERVALTRPTDTWQSSAVASISPSAPSPSLSSSSSSSSSSNATAVAGERRQRQQQQQEEEEAVAVEESAEAEGEEGEGEGASSTPLAAPSPAMLAIGPAARRRRPAHKRARSASTVEKTTERHNTDGDADMLPHKKARPSV